YYFFSTHYIYYCSRRWWAAVLLWGTALIAEARPSKEGVTLMAYRPLVRFRHKDGISESLRIKGFFGQNGFPGHCEHKYCGLGKHCVVDRETGEGECQCLESCKPHYKPVCGSDGKLYQNHCELHRASCMAHQRITIMHSEECFYKDDNCHLGDYKKLKTEMLDLHAQRYLSPGNHGSHENDMATRKHLVDMMFKRFDADGNGRVDSSELSQVSPNKTFTKSLSFFSFTRLIDLRIIMTYTVFDIYCCIAPRKHKTMSAFVIGEMTNNKRYSTLLRTRI
uniref:Follistatin-like 5 n=1 Tax=Sinocyclocheilus grahami TaxID=75366 RepID=A0A672NF18_SINGR